MKTNLRLLAILALLLISFNNINAQIVYTEIPASLDQGQDFLIDFNHDGTAEFNVYTTDHQADYIDYDGTTQANIHALGTNANQWDVPNCVDAGFTIDASNNWIGQGDCSITNWGNGNSSITTDQDEYLAVRFSIGTNTYYGWIRIEVDFENNVTFKDFAYNSTPNTAINAGDTGNGASVSEINNQVFSVFPNPAVNTLNIIIKDNIHFETLEIFNILGRKIKSISNNNIKNNKIDVSALPKGVYILKISDNNKATYSQKIIKQ